MNYWCQVIVVPDPDKVKWYDNDVDGDDYDYDDIIDDDDDVDSIAASIFVDITVLVKSNNNSTNIEAAMLSRMAWWSFLMNYVMMIVYNMRTLVATEARRLWLASIITLCKPTKGSILQFEIEKAMDWCDSLCSPLITDKLGWAAKP